MKKLAVISMLLLTIFWVACQQKKEPVKVEVSQQDTVKLEKVTPPVVQKVEEPDRGVNLDDKYFVIFNSYTVEEFAKDWKKKFEKEGFKPGIVMRNDNGYYCLALESYSDLALANEAKDRLSKEEGLEDVWIMPK